jgi:hypothetical protein
VCEIFGKPVVMNLEYTAEGEDNYSHAQKSDKVKIEDFATPPHPDTVWIVVNDNDKWKDGKKWFQGEVDKGEVFTVDARNAGEDKLTSDTRVHILDEEGGTLLQRIKFHTSCSQPIRIDDEFGSVRIDEFWGEESTDIPGAPGSGAADLCDTGKPAVLTLQYTSELQPVVTAQNPDKWSIQGDATGYEEVYIIANDNSNPDSGKQWFAGAVDSFNPTFEVDASNAGSSRLSTETWIHIYEYEDGPLLQKVRFHTSCSQPIRLGDQYGSISIVGFEAE